MRWLAGCLLAGWAGFALAGSINVQLYDSFDRSYSTTMIGDELGAAYAIGFDPIMVLILGPSLDDERVAEQREIARELDPEETGVLYAIGTSEGDSYTGYRLTAGATSELLDDGDAFRVLVLDANGEIRVDAASPLGADELIAETPPEE